MKIVGLILLCLLPIQAIALTCSVKGSDGNVYYRQITKTKSLGYVATVKPCKNPVLMIPYENNHGMRLYTNDKQCLFLKVENGSLMAYNATQIVNGEEKCP